jgi:bacterioferritin (cytochrome b1)
MKSFIPKQPKHTRERIEAKLDTRLVQRLEQYCAYLESDRDYVLTQALELVLRKDKGFADWLASRGESFNHSPAVAENR